MCVHDSESSPPRLDSSYTATARRWQYEQIKVWRVISSEWLSGGNSMLAVIVRVGLEQSGQKNATVLLPP